MKETSSILIDTKLQGVSPIMTTEQKEQFILKNIGMNSLVQYQVGLLNNKH